MIYPSLDDKVRKECDPRFPADRHSTKRWTGYHERMVQDVQSLSESPQILFLGDSLTERWRGTASLGIKQMPEIAQTFQKYFPNALALGAGGDTTTNLMWHLQHGLLTDTLQPSVIFLLIGTNDLGNMHCTAEHTLAAILYLVDQLHAARPKAKILVHTLFPRSDVYRSGNYTVGTLWDDIQWINAQLWSMDTATQPKQRPYLRIIDHGSDLFMINSTTINKKIMKDGLHPSEKGYRDWAPLLAQDIKTLTGFRM